MLTVEKMGGANSLYGTRFKGLTKDLISIDNEQVPNGSEFYNIESGQTLVFDAETKSWFLKN